MSKCEWLQERRSGESSNRPHDPRLPEDRDLARIIHSASYRRMQSKTQVLGLGESDFYRTRLTHSTEVAQIATGIKRKLDHDSHLPRDIDIPTFPTVTAIALAHDIGHPPFGHGGEVALNYMMRSSGSFEGNAQTLRILSKLEPKTETLGLDLTRRTLLGVLKYPVMRDNIVRSDEPSVNRGTGRSESGNNLRVLRAEDWKPPKCYYKEEADLVEWVLEPFSTKDRRLFQECSAPTLNDHGKATHRSFDATIMDVADDISYAVHDLEDAIHMRFVSIENGGQEAVRDAIQKCNMQWIEEFDLGNVKDDLFSAHKWMRKDAIGKLVNALIGSAKITELSQFDHPLMRYRITLNGDAKFLQDALHDIVRNMVIGSPEVQTLEYRGQQMVMELFEAMSADPVRLLPRDTKLRRSGNEEKDTRLLSDHISGMTDDYATRIYERLFMPRSGSLLQKM